MSIGAYRKPKNLKSFGERLNRREIIFTLIQLLQNVWSFSRKPRTAVALRIEATEYTFLIESRINAMDKQSATSRYRCILQKLKSRMLRLSLSKVKSDVSVLYGSLCK